LEGVPSAAAGGVAGWVVGASPETIVMLKRAGAVAAGVPARAAGTGTGSQRDTRYARFPSVTSLLMLCSISAMVVIPDTTLISTLASSVKESFLPISAGAS